MKCYIVDTLIGIFAVDEAINVINFIDFNNNLDKLVDFYKLIEEEDLNDDYVVFLDQLNQSGFNEFVFDNEKLASLSTEKGINVSISKKDPYFKHFRLDLENQLKKIGIHKTQSEISQKFKYVSEELVKFKIQEAGGELEQMIIQNIEALDILKKSISLFSSRLREWYGLHFPELTDKLIEDNVVLAKIVFLLGRRDNFTKNQIELNFDFPEKRIKALQKLASESMGAEIEMTILQEYANQILHLERFRNEMENYLDKLMEQVAPNLTALIGSLIGAKLISKAGSLKKLAFMPASRIQLLGAEKALYRFLKTGEKRPKHGLIFQWNQIRGSKPHLRGKIARVIAGKLGIAAKIDYFNGEFIGEDLSQEIGNKIKKIEIKYSKPKSKQKKRRRE